MRPRTPFCTRFFSWRRLRCSIFFSSTRIHAGELHRGALVERRLHGERLEQAVVGEDRAHFTAALEVGFVLGGQLLDVLPSLPAACPRRRTSLAAVAGEFLLDADQPVLLLDLVEGDARHAEQGNAVRQAGTYVLAGPDVLGDGRVLAALDSQHRDRRECLALVAAGEHDRRGRAPRGRTP